MKVLLDHNLDRRLKSFLTDFDVSTTQEQEWSDLAILAKLKAIDSGTIVEIQHTNRN